MNRELTFVVPMEDWSPGPVKFDGKIFSIESELFTDIIQLFSAFNEADASNAILFPYILLLTKVVNLIIYIYIYS